MISIDEEKQHINEHVEKENFHAAINLSISAMNACRKEDNMAGVKEFLDYMQHIIEIMRDKYLVDC